MNGNLLNGNLMSGNLMSGNLMKALLFVLLASAAANAQLNSWVAKNPPNQTGSFHALQMITPSRTCLVGDNGTIMLTTDGGNAWTTKQYGTSPLHAVYFLDSLYGITVGTIGKGFMTHDGGASWQPINTKSVQNLNSAVFIDKRVGLICGDNATLLISQDSGVTWKLFPSELPVGNIHSLKKLRGDFVIMVGDLGTVYITKDTAQTFLEASLAFKNTIYDIAFSDSDHAIVVSDLGQMYGTSDGGKHWRSEDSTDYQKGNILYSVDFKGGSNAIVTGQLGRIISTTDGGATWTLQFLGVTGNIEAVSMLDSMTAIACGSDGVIVKTTDAGKTWEFLPRRPQTSLLRTIKMFSDLSTGVAAGSNGAILRSTDAGNTWFPVDAGTFRTLYASAYLGGKGFLVGENGTIIATTDSGATWSPRTSGVTKNLRAVAYPTANAVYAFGDNGTFIKSIDGGNYWVRYPSSLPDSIEVNSCSFADSLVGLITANNSILRTTDAGISWTSVLPPPTPDFYFILKSVNIGISHKNAFAAGAVYSGILHPVALYSSDKGLTWTTIDQPKVVPTAVISIDGVHATAVGPSGFTIHTVEYDSLWNVQYTPTTANLLGVSFGSIKAGYSCGTRGTILRIDTDEEDGKAGVFNYLPSVSEAIHIERVFPNPAVRRIRVTYSNNTGGPVSAEVFDLRGVRIGEFDLGFSAAGEQSADLNLPELANGSYILMIRSGSSMASTLVTVEH